MGKDSIERTPASVERAPRSAEKSLYAALDALEEEAREAGGDFFNDVPRGAYFARHDDHADWLIHRYDEELIPKIPIPQYDISVRRRRSSDAPFLLGEDIDRFVDTYHYRVRFDGSEYHLEPKPPRLLDSVDGDDLRSAGRLELVRRLMAHDTRRTWDIRRALDETSMVSTAESGLQTPFERNRTWLANTTGLSNKDVILIRQPEDYFVEQGRTVLTDGNLPLPDGTKNDVEYKDIRYIIILREIQGLGGWGSGAHGTGQYRVEQIRMTAACQPEEVISRLKGSRLTIQGI